MLEYKLIKATPTLIKTPNCLDDIMATLFEKYHIDYIKFYRNCLEFEFKNLGSEDVCDNIKYYMFEEGKYVKQGLDFKVIDIKDIGERHFISYAQNMLKNGQDLIVNCDAHYEMWDSNFDKKQSGHIVLLNDIDDHIATIIDPYNEIQKCQLTIEKFFARCNFFILIDNIKECKDNFNYADLEFSQEGIKNVVNNLSLFFEKCKSNPNLIHIEEFNDFIDVPLYDKLMQGMVLHNQYIQFLSNLIKYNKDRRWEILRYKLNNLQAIWVSLLMLIVKGTLKKGHSYTKEKFILRIGDLYEGYKKLLVNIEEYRIESNSRKLFEGRLLDVRKYNNNKGFSATCVNSIADITSGCDEFIVLKDDGKYYINGISFSIDANEKYDNIKCKEQIVDLDVYCSSIAFVFLAEWGSFQECIRFNCYEYTYIGDFFVEDMANADRYNSANNFDLGKSYKFGKCERDKNFARYIRFDFPTEVKIRYIILPNCENIHLLAIKIL